MYTYIYTHTYTVCGHAYRHTHIYSGAVKYDALKMCTGVLNYYKLSH